MSRLLAVDLLLVFKSVCLCRDAEDTFYDRTEGGQRRKHVVEVESLDAATLLGQKVLPPQCACVLCNAMLCFLGRTVLCRAVSCCGAAVLLCACYAVMPCAMFTA